MACKIWSNEARRPTSTIPMPSLYERLVNYPGHHAVAPGKSQTYSVEADNAELRHYLARLGRKSRCFSRSIDALRRAVKLFVYAWNRRQLHRRAYPSYACHVMDFICPPN